MINTLDLIRNIGTFESVDTGARLPLNQFALIYAENGRGKTTLASIFRSLGSGNPVPIMERRRLGSLHSPHIVVTRNGGQRVVFQNGEWDNNIPDVVVFDDHFISENICSGMEVASGHRQNLHELIIGAQGVVLNSVLQEHIDRIEQHNRDLQIRSNAIPANARFGMSVQDFCNLEERDDIDDSIQEAERHLAAARQANKVRQQPHFEEISLPRFDADDIDNVICRELQNLEADAASQVQEHLAKIGEDSESWVGDGMERVISDADGGDICPFCAQDLEGSRLITHYQAYFSDAYTELKASITALLQNINTSHGGEIQAAFERSVLTAERAQQFWMQFTDVPEIAIDTAKIALAWKEAYTGIEEVLQVKQSSPLESLQIDEDLLAKISAYHTVCDDVTALSDALQATHDQIEIVKEKAAAADITSLENDLRRLQTIKSRFSQGVSPLCDAYLQEKRDKTDTEGLRDTARADLDHYREQVFSRYEAAINNYLQRFNAGFRLENVQSVNTRAGSTCNYSVLINEQSVPISGRGEGEPSFKNTLSAGDRNALALAFFFASLENDPNNNQRIVVIDDPMTSLDDHRALTTIQEMRRLSGDVAQVIVFSHSKPFLCDLWQGADSAGRSACKIARSNPGSTFVEWDVNQDSITEHDKRHAIVREYVQNSVGSDERSVAAALRPIMESYMRVACPEWFPPGTLLGPFLGLCQQRVGADAQILSEGDITELRALLDYANQFHHNTNPAWQTVVINDHELLGFSRRALAFTSRT